MKRTDEEQDFTEFTEAGPAKHRCGQFRRVVLLSAKVDTDNIRREEFPNKCGHVNRKPGLLLGLSVIGVQFSYPTVSD